MSSSCTLKNSGDFKKKIGEKCSKLGDLKNPKKYIVSMKQLLVTLLYIYDFNISDEDAQNHESCH